MDKRWLTLYCPVLGITYPVDYGSAVLLLESHTQASGWPPLSWLCPFDQFFDDLLSFLSTCNNTPTPSGVPFFLALYEFQPVESSAAFGISNLPKTHVPPGIS